MLAKGAQTPFEPLVVLLQVIILFERVMLFVNTVIRQLVEQIWLGIIGGILLSCESGKSFLENVNPQWLIRSDANVNSKIKFMAVYQERILDIPRDDYLFFVIDANFWHIINNVDTPASTQIRRFDNPKVFLSIDIFVLPFKTLDKFSILLWYTVGLRQKINLCSRVPLGHIVNIYA